MLLLHLQGQKRKSFFETFVHCIHLCANVKKKAKTRHSFQNGLDRVVYCAQQVYKLDGKTLASLF